MEFDENIMKMAREINGFLPTTTAEEKARKLEPHFKKSNHTNKAKLLFYLILNSELDVRDELIHLKAIYFLIGSCSRNSLNDLCVIIFQLELFSALSDIVSTCPVVISNEIINCLREKIFKSDNKYEHCRKLAVAMYDKHYKLVRNFHNECYRVSAFDVFLLLLPSSFKSDANQSLEKTFSEINCQLQIWGDCLKRRRIEDMSAFRFSMNDEHCDPVCVDFETPTSDTIIYFSEFLSYFRKILEDSDLPDDSPMRKTVCGSAHFLYETIKGRNLIKDEDEKWLESIKRDELSECNIAFVIDKISDYETDRKWFNKLISFPKWFENVEAVSLVSNYLNVIDSDESKAVIDSLRNSNLAGDLSKIYLDCFGRISIEDQIIYFEKHFEENRNFLIETPEDELTEKFNKLSESDAKTRTWLITSCIKSPTKTITELCKLAVSNTAMVRPCVECLQMLRVACLSSGADDLNVITQVMKSFLEEGKFTSSEKLLLFTLVSKLQELQFLDLKFVKFCILKSIESNVKEQNLEKVVLSLELLKSWLRCGPIPVSDQVVLVAFVIRALSHTSWDCSTFSTELAQARELVIDILACLMKSSHKFTDVQTAWLRREILKSSDMNQLYFCDFLYLDGSQSLNSKEDHLQLFALLHSKTKVQSLIDSLAGKYRNKKFLQLRTTLIHFLIKILPVLTSREWTSLFAQLKSVLTSWSNLQIHASPEKVDLFVVDLLAASLYCLVQDNNQYGDMSSCLEHCIRNYGRVIQKNFLVDGNVDVRVRIDLAKKILFLLNGVVDSAFRASSSMILSSVFLRIADCPSGDEHSLRFMTEWFKKDFIQH